MGRRKQQPSSDDALEVVSDGGTVYRLEEAEDAATGRKTSNAGQEDAVLDLLGTQYDPSVVEEVRRYRCVLVWSRPGRRRRQVQWRALPAAGAGFATFASPKHPNVLVHQ
jgi:hypothetical protein